MKRKLKLHQVVKKLKEKKMNLFTPLDFRRVFDVSNWACRWFIKIHTKEGDFLKLRKGLYMLADHPVNYYLIANRLYEPSYISFDAALSFYGIIPETIYTIISATPKTTRECKVENIRFVYHKLKKGTYTGYKAIKHQDSTILIAEAEKALADYLYFIELKKRNFSYERLNLKKIKKSKLVAYVKLFKRPRMNKLIEKIYAEFRKPKRIY